MLARLVGPAVVGDQGFAVLTATLLGLIAMRGLDLVALREIAGALRQADEGAAAGVLRYARRWISVSAVGLSLLWALLSLFTPIAERLAVDAGALAVASVGIASVALSRLGLAAVRGLGRPVAGQFLEGLSSLLFVAMIAVAFWRGDVFDAQTAVVLFFTCQSLAMVAIWIIVQRATRGWAVATAVDGGKLTRAGLPMMAVQATHMFSDWLLLALIAGAASAADMGAMRVAMQIVLVLTLVVATGETYLSAKVAGDIRAGRPDLVWARHRRASLAMALALGPLVLICIVFPAPLLAFAFGPAFVVAAPALAIMAIGQATKTVTGPIGGLLNMAGHERALMAITAAGVILLLVLAFLLVPIWGLTGAATAHAASVAFRNIFTYVAARRLVREG
ncbi:lipopolysaccharide biosynthesis protein [Polymorphobacter multimanifer]|uniref:O-antigen/teichoic acid export membrane protein n=1 Tax=Polymorphobacter multimanifer TaxID=1070431 RepID=A0A841L9U2_9SPHN|nr:polysaccharide biosynthesis C-terminal domain-containing protein [Polymorphobacter multimanifer]MBB6229200.1 O-antigen/teichoic acid export membrane protein [Polymorphobacter multimanifer]